MKIHKSTQHRYSTNKDKDTSKKVSYKKSDILIGIDYGERNIGLALGRSGTVMPLRTIEGKNMETAIHEIIKIALHNRATKFVVGLPVTLRGKETPQSLKTRRFVKMLKIRSKKPVFLVEEYGTSKEAVEEAMRMHLSKKRRRIYDHLSAGIILKRFYEEHSPQK